MLGSSLKLTLKLLLLGKSVSMYVCVSAPKDINNYPCKMNPLQFKCLLYTAIKKLKLCNMDSIMDIDKQQQIIL